MAQRIEKELQQQIMRLRDDQQLRVLEFARSLSEAHENGQSGQALLRFAGTIERDNILIMEAAIDNGCEIANPTGF